MVLLCPSHMVPKRHSMAAMPGFKSQHQSSFATPLPTLPTIGCQLPASPYFSSFSGCHSKSGQVWPCGVEPIISKLLRRLCNHGDLPPSYIMGWRHSHPPASKQGHSCLTYLWNQLKVIDMLNDCSRGYLQNCCYSKQLSMALLHASHPPAQACGSQDILHIYIYFFFLIFPGHRVLNPITNPYLRSPLAAPCYNRSAGLSTRLLSTCLGYLGVFFSILLRKFPSFALF